MIRYLVKNILTEAFYTRFGQEMLRIGLYATRFRVFGARTTKLMEFDLARLKARAKHPPRGEKIAAPSDRLHLGCGGRCVWRECLHLIARKLHPCPYLPSHRLRQRIGVTAAVEEFRGSMPEAVTVA